MNNYLEIGTWNVICDRCGFKYKAYQLQKEWTGFMVCKGPGTHDCFEYRHPQDLIRIPKEDTSVPWTRPEPEDEFVSVTYVAESVGIQQNDIPEGNFDDNNGTI